MLLIGSERPLWRSLSAGCGLVGLERGRQDVGDFVVGKRLDGVVEDLVLAIRRSPAPPARSPRPRRCGLRRLLVDPPDQVRPRVAQRGGVQEDHPAFALGQRAEQALAIAGPLRPGSPSAVSFLRLLLGRRGDRH